MKNEMKGTCPMRRPTLRVHVHHQNDQDPGKFHIARLHCIFALRCVLCCQGTSESDSLRLAPECSALPSMNIHARVIREYSTIRVAGRELFDSHKVSIRFTPRICPVFFFFKG